MSNVLSLVEEKKARLYKEIKPYLKMTIDMEDIINLVLEDIKIEDYSPLNKKEIVALLKDWIREERKNQTIPEEQMNEMIDIIVNEEDYIGMPILAIATRLFDKSGIPLPDALKAVKKYFGMQNDNSGR